MAVPVVDTAGIGDLLRDFGKIDKTLRAALVKELRDVGNEVRDKVRSSTAPPHRTGRLRRSIKTGVRKGAISLYSNLPYAGVVHWGGTVKPRGTPIRFPRTEFLTKEVAVEGDHVDDRLAGVLDGTATRYGFHL